MTSLSGFTGTLAKMGVDGPKHFKTRNLDSFGQVIGIGTQFTVFADSLGIQDGVVMKRVNKIFLDADITGVSGDDRLRSYFRTLELEILSLCHPPLRDHRNIIDLISWGYDYPTLDATKCLPVLIMEKAMTSLSDFLQSETKPGGARLSWETKHQLCLDISEGLEILHRNGIVHGDVKPDNVLIFKQDNPNVPYLGKLSDFGVCISMEESTSLSFQDYLGTPGWIPAEVVEYREDLHGDFTPELLLKCDSFSYGMVVLSILITGGRPPFQDLEEEEGGSPYEKAIGLIWGNEDESFPASLQGKLMSFCGALLKERPQDRADVSYLLLADNSKGYNDWYELSVINSFFRFGALVSYNLCFRFVAKEAAEGRTRARAPQKVANDANKGPAYWIGLHHTVLEQLEQHFIDTKTGGGPGFPGETLFGMAIRLTMNRKPGFEEKILNYVGEAAKTSYLPAQAIVKRLYEAHGKSLATIADDQMVETWLFKAVSTGSFVAAEDLEKLNPNLLQKAKAAFRIAGGYNNEFSNIATLQGQFSNLSVDIAQKFCKEKGNVEFLVDLDGNRLLHVAAMFDKPEVITYLVKEKGAAINSQNDNGETPLYKACLAGHHSTVETLITLSADASITSKQYGLSPLHWLFNFEKQYIPHIAQLLVSKGKAKVDAIIASEKVGTYEQHIPFEHFPFRWPFGTPLHWAAATRSLTAIDTLLGLGADINKTDSPVESAAQTALAMAARRGDSEIVRYLLKKGADPRKINGQGRNPFHMTAADCVTSSRLFNLWEGLESWVYNGPFENHLHEVRECVLAIRKAGGDLDGRRGTAAKPGNTPLIDASNTYNCVVALALLEAGADANCLEPDSQQFPLHIWASAENRLLAYPQSFPILFQKLIKCTKDLNAKEAFNGETALHMVVRTPGSISEEDFEERVRLLTTQNPPANINAVNEDGTTPLMLALAGRGPGEAGKRFKILRRYKARIDFKANEESRDFIFTICYNPALTDSESLRFLEELLEGYSEAEKRQMACSSVSRVCGTDLTALAAAIQGGKYNCVKYLLELGVDPNALDNKRATALDLALDDGEETRRKFLIILTESFSVTERKEAIERGLAFGLISSYEDTGRPFPPLPVFGGEV